MGLFDNNDDGFFGGLFDFNGDGKTTWDEKFIAFKIFEECAKQNENDKGGGRGSHFNSGIFRNTDATDEYEWRLYCDDGFEFGVDPDDYEAEEEYEEALNEAKYGWRDNCESVFDTGVDPEDFETEEEYQEALEEEKNAWRDICEDGTDYGVDPDDYETEEEYEEALNEAKYEWRDNCESVLNTGVDPEDFETEEEYQEALLGAKDRIDNIGNILNISVEAPVLDKMDEIREEDYPNKRRFNAAYTLANEFLVYGDDDYEKKEKDCCRFILNNADKIIAANYLTYDRGFLYAQAIKDNFDIPCTLPDEDETPEMEFSDIVCKISKRDVPLSFEIWSWCLKQFLPYAKYDDYCSDGLTSKVLDDKYSFSDDYKTKLVHYMSENNDFCKSVMMSSNEPSNTTPELIAEAIKEKLFKTADTLFDYGLVRTNNEWKKINTLVEVIILWCKNYEELESMEYFRDNLFPKVKAIPLGMVQDEIEGWEKEIADYIDKVESDCEQYAFTRKNAWRKTVPNGNEYGLDPLCYKTEQEYLEALNDVKYGWRKWYKDRENYGLNPDDYETQEEYRNALIDRMKEVHRQERDRKLKEQQFAQQAKMQEYENDKTIYTYCGVLLPFSSRPYSFRTEDKSIKIGDTVIVPVGEDGKEMSGKVVSVGQYSRLGVPYPVERTKMIIRKSKVEN